MGRTSGSRVLTARSAAERYIRPKAFSRSVHAVTSEKTLLVVVFVAGLTMSITPGKVGEVLKSDVYAYRIVYAVETSEVRKELIGHVTLLK